MADHALELIELAQTEIAAIDGQYQFWITITFAVMVASYLAHNQLGRAVRVTIVTLYLLATALIVLRTQAHIGAVSFLMTELNDLGSGYKFGSEAYPYVFPVMRLVLMAAGTLAAVVFTLHPNLARESAAQQSAAVDSARDE